MKMPNGLANLRNARGWTQTQVAEAMNLSLGGYRKYEYGERQLKGPIIRRFSELYGASDGEVLGSIERKGVPLVGYVGAGAETHYYSSADDPAEMVDPPDGATDETVAVEVRGESLGALFDRWLVFYDDVRSPITPDLIGRLCVVGLPDGRVLVKQIQRSKTSRHLFHLISNTESPILDATVAWGARVKTMVPR